MTNQATPEETQEPLVSRQPLSREEVLFQGQYQFKKLLVRVSNSLSAISEEVRQLAECESTDTDAKMQMHHEFSRNQFGALCEAAQQVSDMWEEFHQGYNKRAYRELSDAGVDALSLSEEGEGL